MTPDAQAAPSPRFPKNFLWGAATAAYQIEGSHKAEGKGLSIWDMFCRKEGAIPYAVNGDVACDHYRLFKSDVAMMKEMGLKAYRFSIAWTRVLPEGTGKINRKGLDFYEALVDELLQAGIEPCPTLYHWDLPLTLHHQGGWMNRDIQNWFADYADIIGRTLGDRVTWWMTLNEPSVQLTHGYLDTKHAPGLRFSVTEALRCLHHYLLAHGKGVQALRSGCAHSPKIGFAPSIYTMIPQSESPEDIEAARQLLFTVGSESLGETSLYLDPIFLGRYPQEAPDFFGSKWHNPSEEDLKTIHQPLDFIGFNTYSGLQAKAGADGKPVIASYRQEHPTGALDWLRLAPSSLYWTARFLNERYGKNRLPIVVTENGFCNLDWVGLDNRVHDGARIDYVHRHLLGFKRASEEGIPLGGYFYWTLMDNFEWAEGYKPRFGLIHVDYATQVRTWKDSAFWYRDVINSNGAHL